MSTATTAITDQAGVNSAADFDTAAASTLGIDNAAFPETEATPAEKVPAEQKTGDAGATASCAAADGTKPAEWEKSPEQLAAEAAAADPFAFDAKTIEALLADPAHGPVVKGLYEKFTKAVELAKIWGPEGQEARALVPGGLAELKERLELERSARAEAADFSSGDPARQKSALLSVAEENPEQFVAGMPLYLGIVAEKTPQAFQSFLGGKIRETLEGEGVVSAMAAMFAAAKANNGEGDEKAFGEAFGTLSQWFEKAGFTSAAAAKPVGAKAAEKKEDPEVTALKERLAKYENQDKQAHEQAWNTWSGETNTEVSKQVREAAKARLEDFLPTNIEKNFREFTMNQLLDKVESEVIRQLTADLGHQEKLNAVLNGQAWKKDGAAARTQIVNLQTGRAKLLLADIVKKLMDPATKATVDAAKTKNDKEKTAASRADVTGAGGNSQAKPITAEAIRKMEKERGRPLTEEEILEM